MMALKAGSYEAYCFDEAVISFGLILESKLDMAGRKLSKEDRKIQAARQRILDKIFSDEEENKKSSGFADPALMFG